VRRLRLPLAALLVAAAPTASSAPEAAAPAGSEPWHLAGASLAGSLEGPTEIDSLEIRHGALWIRARRGVWQPTTQVVDLEGPLEIRDSLRVLQARRGRYHRTSSRLELEEDVRGEGPEGRFFADRLTHDRVRRELTLSGFVRLIEGARRLQSQWLRYTLDDSVATAGDDLRLQDEADSLEVEGRHLHYDRRAGRMTVVGSADRRPRMTRLTPDAGASLVVEADTLRLQTGSRTGDAEGRVVLRYGEGEGTCARLRWLPAQDRAWLLGSPEIHERTGSLRGDTMSVALRAGRAERVNVWRRAVSEYRPLEHPGETHFAVGDTLTAFLAEGAIQSVVLEGRAQALYLPSAADRRGGVGLNWTRGRRLRLGFAGRGVERVQFEGEVSGRYLLPLASAADTTRAAGSAADSTGPGGYDPSVLSALRARAGEGDCDPPDSLLARLPFNPAETVRYQGQRLEFAVADERIWIAGTAKVGYQDMELESEEVVFNAPRDLVVASGEPVLRDRDNEVRGERMTYRIDNRQGLVFRGRSSMGTGHYRGERVKRVEPRALFVRNGEYTTCDADTAHFHFLAPAMKVIPQQKVIARPVILFLGRIPVLAIPYAVFPTRRGRQSGILTPGVEFGFDTSRGRFLNNVGYYWAPNDYADGLFWLDYYEREPRVTLNTRLRYRLRYALDGSVEASYTRQTAAAGQQRRRWLLRVSHDQVLGERFSLKASSHFQSDKDYGADRDFGASVDERINQTLRSQIGLNKAWSGASLSLVADRTENLPSETCPGGSVEQTVPSLGFSLNTLPLGVKPDARGRGGRWSWLASTYVRGDLRFRSTYRRACAACDTGGCTVVRATNQGAGVNLSLSDKRQVLGAISVTPSATATAAWAARDPKGRTNLAGATWGAGLAAGTTVYGTFLPRLGPWEGLRHVVDFRASYSYRPEKESLRGFPDVSGVSLGSARSSTASLSCNQRFHVKWRRGEKTIKQENLFTWSVSTAYDFLAREKARAGQTPKPWSRISHAMRLQPGSALGSDLSLSHDPERWRHDYNLSLRTTLRLKGGEGARDAAPAPESDAFEGHGGFGDPAGSAGTGPERSQPAAAAAGPWQMTLTHALSRSRTGDQHSAQSSANLSLSLAPTAGWRLQYSVYYDLTDKEVTSQGYTLSRDLHCWQAFLERRASGGRSAYYFRISVKDLPDIKYERRRG
jgi:lipopolysaccharide export system protein LptA